MAAIPTIPGVSVEYPWLDDAVTDGDPGIHLQRFAAGWEYPVHFTNDVFSWENLAFVRAIARHERRGRQRLVVLVDRAVAEAHPCLLEDVVRYVHFHGDCLDLVRAPVVLDGGERVKNDPGLPSRLHALFDAQGLDRRSFVVVVGGGALQDAVGYAAATAHRGLRVVRVPTTALAQADSGVGIRNGVNAFGKKNAIGTFAPPFAVIADSDFLRTLPTREVGAGLAEALRIAVVRDAAFFDWICAHAGALACGEHDVLASAVRRCALHHLDHLATAGDPFELARELAPRPLDFARWAADELEVLTGFEIRHGEALAIAVALETVHSSIAGLLSNDDAQAILSAMDALRLPTWHAALERAAPSGRVAILAARAERGATLLEGVGRAVDVHAVDEALVLEAIERLRRRADVR